MVGGIKLKNCESELKQLFESYTKELEPRPCYIKRVVMAFIVGGAFSLLGECFYKLYESLGFDEVMFKTLTSISMIFIGAFLTGIGVYDKIGNVAGAGSIIPITGFANAMVSPSIEFKKEGIVFGSCVKMFTIAGSVIVFGISSSVLVGVIHFIIKRLGVL